MFCDTILDLTVNNRRCSSKKIYLAYQWYLAYLIRKVPSLCHGKMYIAYTMGIGT